MTGAPLLTDQPPEHLHIPRHGALPDIPQIRSLQAAFLTCMCSNCMAHSGDLWLQKSRWAQKNNFESLVLNKLPLDLKQNELAHWKSKLHSTAWNKAVWNYSEHGGTNN
ncbi:hypothetical protein VP01_4343g1, partial [Puccinia sorghi]